MKKIKGFIVIFAVVIAVVMQGNTQKVEAASKNIKVEDFIEYVVKQMKWSVDENSEQPYIDAALNKGIIRRGDFNDYQDYLTRTDCAVIANRIDGIINQRFGYSQEVYEFLRDCKLFEGVLYYDLNGSYFPEGETYPTYNARNFGNDIANSILLKAFPNDSWVERGLRTRYQGVFEPDGSRRNTFIMIGMALRDKYNDVEADPFDEDSEIVEAWNTIKDGNRKIKAVLDERISDIKDIPLGKREAVASIVAKGIIKGYSNGMYVQNREFRGNNYITASGAKDVIKKVLNPSLRALISPDGQLIRTTNLPKNTNDYEYILECFPNEFYEMKFNFTNIVGFKEGIVKKSSYAYPVEVDYDYLYENHYDKLFKVDMDKYELYDKALNQVEKYLEHIFSVDYRNIDVNWKNGLLSSFTKSNDWRLSDWIDDYIKAMQNNRVIVEYQHVAIDPGTIYKSVGKLYVRVYVKYKITADNINTPAEELLYGRSTYLKGLENGKWRYGYYDIEIVSSTTSDGYRWGIGSLYSINDSMFLISK